MTWPPSRLTRLRTINSPRPVPVRDRSSSFPRRTKRPKILRRSGCGNAAPVVDDARDDGVLSLGVRFDFHARLAVGIFDGIVDQIAEDHFQVHRPGTDQRRLDAQLDDLGGQVVSQAGGAGAGTQHFGQFDVAFGFDRLLIEPGGVEQVVDQGVEPLDVVEHEAIEIGLPLFVDVPPAERLQIELQRGDRRFQLVRYAVDEVRLPPVEADFLDRNQQVQHHAHQHQHQKRGSHGQQSPIDARVRGPLTVTSTQPMMSATTSTIMITPSAIGSRSEVRMSVNRLA